MYEIANTTSRPMTGQAIPSYGPRDAAQHFRKLDCFCFATQTLQPGEVRQMPVVFVLDPEAPADLPTITLSYTFFEVEGGPASAASATSGAHAGPDATARARPRRGRHDGFDDAGGQPAYYIPQPSHWPIIGVDRAAADGHRAPRSGSTATRAGPWMVALGFATLVLHAVRLVRHGHRRVRGAASTARRSTSRSAGR